MKGHLEEECCYNPEGTNFKHEMKCYCCQEKGHMKFARPINPESKNYHIAGNREKASYSRRKLGIASRSFINFMRVNPFHSKSADVTTYLVEAHPVSIHLDECLVFRELHDVSTGNTELHGVNPENMKCWRENPNSNRMPKMTGTPGYEKQGNNCSCLNQPTAGAEIETGKDKSILILDGGATDHVCSDMRLFESIDYQMPKSITIANGETLTVAEGGTFKFRNDDGDLLFIRGALYCPFIHTNVISVFRPVKEQGPQDFIRKRSRRALSANRPKICDRGSSRGTI